MNDPLDLLLADGVIDEVLGRLKSGKEANISLVRRGELVIAAKVYKDRATRSFKNNADYKEGRKVRNSRTQRAIDGGGRFGRDAAEQAWKSAEADALYKLAGSGVRVPAPVMFYEGVLLMDLVCDAIVESRTHMPVGIVAHRQVVAGKLMDVHGLGVEQHRSAWIGASIEGLRQLPQRGAGFETVPQGLVGIELGEVVGR